MIVQTNSSLKGTVLVLPSLMWDNILYYVIIIPNGVLYNGNSLEKNISVSILGRSKLVSYIFKGLSSQFFYKSILLMEI